MDELCVKLRNIDFSMGITCITLSTDDEKCGFCRKVFVDLIEGQD